MNRRELLFKLSAAFTAAAVAPLFDALDPDEHEQVTRVMQDSLTFDVPALRYCEGMITSLRQQGDVLGPQLTLHSAIGHRRLAQRLARAAPDNF